MNRLIDHPNNMKPQLCQSILNTYYKCKFEHQLFHRLFLCKHNQEFACVASHKHQSGQTSSQTRSTDRMRHDTHINAHLGKHTHTNSTHAVRLRKDQRSDVHRRFGADSAAYISIGVWARRGDIR